MRNVIFMGEMMTSKQNVLKRYPQARCIKERNIGPGYVTMYAVYLNEHDKAPERGFSAAQAWTYTLDFRILPQRPLYQSECTYCGLRIGLGEKHEAGPFCPGCFSCLCVVGLILDEI